MPRLDAARVSFALIPHPKGVQSSRGAGFLGAEPAGIAPGRKSTVVLLTPTRAEVILPATSKEPMDAATTLPWAMTRTDTRGNFRASLWRVGTGATSMANLPAKGYAQVHANGFDGATVFGNGSPRGDAPDRALLWIEGGEPLALTTPDPEVSTIGHDVRGGVQVGMTGGIFGHACLWRGTPDSFVDLNPPGFETSTAYGTDGHEQAGMVVREALYGLLRRAALWRGTADSFVDLAPDGWAVSVANCCAGGCQAGFAERTPRSNEVHARVWQGSANDSIDLHPAEGGWTASLVKSMRAEPGRLVLVGTVERRPPGELVLLEERVCTWTVEFA